MVGFSRLYHYFECTMAYKSYIDWTDATWNPVTGCSKVSKGCENCYTERFSERFRGVKGHPYQQGFDLKRGIYPKQGGNLLDGRVWNQYPDVG